MRFAYAAIILISCLGTASNTYAQAPKMTENQQAWFYCLVSTEWCWAESLDKTQGQERGVAMVAAKQPLTVKGRPSRVTLQIACSQGKLVAMLHSGREIEEQQLLLQYKIGPHGKVGDLTATNASANHFFEFPTQQFLSDLKGGASAAIVVSSSSEGQRPALEFNVSGSETILKRLSCYQ